MPRIDESIIGAANGRRESAGVKKQEAYASRSPIPNPDITGRRHCQTASLKCCRRKP